MSDLGDELQQFFTDRHEQATIRNNVGGSVANLGGGEGCCMNLSNALPVSLKAREIDKIVKLSERRHSIPPSCLRQTL